YKSGLSTPFTFNNGGAWSFGAKYIENPSSPDYGNVADLGCEAWSIPQVNTDIYAKGTPDTKVTGGSVLVGSGIYDTASVDTKSAAVIPGTSSIEFRRFKTANCTGDYTDASIGTGAVALNTGATTGTAKSIDSIVDARYLSYLAIFHSGNEGLVSSVADTTVYVQGGAPGCEPLTAIGKPLDVTKDVSAALDRLYKWKINKSVDSSLKEAANSSTFNYTVKVDQDGAPVDSNYTTSGTISVSNPNYWDVTGVAITDSIDNGGNCTLTGGSNVTIVAGAPASQFSYSCSYSGAPSKFSGTNTGTATYTDASINGGSQTATNGTAGYTFSMNATNKTIHVTDNLQGPLGTLTGTDAPAYASATYTYSRTQTPAAGKCTTENNTATITETGQNSSASATACNMKTGALTIGYWQNKNGQAIITGGASTSGVCNSGTFLRQFAPFQDLSPTANCNQVNTYVQGIIKSANASGTTMNAMLKAQMLATALDVYFSSPAGGSKIGNVSLGGVKINLTIIPTAPGASTTEDASPEFGGSPKTVLEILQAASANSNVGGTVSYGQNKPTQEFAKDTFDAINNEVAPIF
ncbi:MAG TPA: hypothetical protein VFU28_07305, partial [Vicinamibacterales bacterium]|nr:hypothetical protein [Vicinamibacterales bacterium]